MRRARDGRSRCGGHRRLDAARGITRSRRLLSLARFVGSLEPNANQTHGVQYFERTLDDSANRRLVIPESFLAADAILILMGNITSGLEVHPTRIRQRVADELPFMATEELIVRAVRAGGDRQAAHEVIRRHSVAAARAMKDNDMVKRLMWSGLLAALGAAASIATTKVAHLIWVRAFGEDPPE